MQDSSEIQTSLKLLTAVGLLKTSLTGGKNNTTFMLLKRSLVLKEMRL